MGNRDDRQWLSGRGELLHGFNPSGGFFLCFLSLWAGVKHGVGGDILSFAQGYQGSDLRSCICGCSNNIRPSLKELP